MVKKRSICILTMFIVVASIITGCSSFESNELEKLRQENENLKKQLSEVLDSGSEESTVLPTETEESEDAQRETPRETENVECTDFQSLVFTGSGDDVITDINLPYGVYVANIKMESDAYNSIKFYTDVDDYELLVSAGSPYYGTTLVKGSKYCEVNGGIFEVKSNGNWSIQIDELSGRTTTNLTGSGDVVTGLFGGSGKMETITICMNSDSYHSVKLFEYGDSEDYLDYDLLVSDSGEYIGKCLVNTKEGEQYFFTVESEGNWSIDFGHGVEETKYEISNETIVTESFSNIESEDKSDSVDLGDGGEFLSETSLYIDRFNNLYKDGITEGTTGQDLLEYQEEDGRVFYPVKDWITIVVSPTVENNSVDHISLRFDPVGRKGPWILDVMVMSEYLLQAVYTDIDGDDASDVTTYYEEALYDGKWNWPGKDEEGRYIKNGINCDLYRAVDSLIFVVTP